MLAYWEELEITPHTVNSSSNTPRVTSGFSKKRLTTTLSWGAGEGSWETGESSSGFVPLLPWGMGTGKKKKDCRILVSKSGRQDHPPTSSSSEGSTVFCCSQAQFLAEVFCQLMQKQDPHLAQGTHSNTGGIQTCSCLLAHHLKIPIYCSQFEAAEKLTLLRYFMWNDYWNKQLQWHTVVGWR